MSSNGDDGEPIEVSPPSSPVMRASSSIHSRSSRSHSRSSSSGGGSRRSRSGSRSRSRSSSRHSTTVVPAHIPGNHHSSTHNHSHGHSHHDNHHTPNHESYHEPKPEITPISYFDSGDSSWPPRHSLLSRLALPIALVVAACIIGGATYAVVAHVQTLLANASIDGDITSWKRRARDEVYDACYNGCTSCNDPDFAYNACQKTASAIVRGINCDGGRMWNWAAQDRYPDQCLAAVAGILMGEALERLKQSYRNQLALITVTVLGGLLGGFLTYKGMRMVTMTKAERRAARDRRTWSLFKPHTWHMPSLNKYPGKHGAVSLSSASTARAGKNKKLTAAFLGLFGSRAVAYPCVGHDAAWSQFFASPNGTITGVVHGWFSECRDRRNCTKTCRDSCTTSASGTRTCSNKCTESCNTVTYSERVPKDYVDKVVPKVRACGFNVVDALNGAAVTTRVANAGIERNLWVRISVNGYNVTRPTETDPMVVCLHAIGN